MAQKLNKYTFHKHLVEMECRKDIILENDFINKRIKDQNIWLLHKYKQKVKSNKMRLLYLGGFCAFFSLGFLYDFIFDSKWYHRASSFIFERKYLPALSQLQTPKVNYHSNEAKQLGSYFLALQKQYPHCQITASLLSNRISQLAQFGQNLLDANTFVEICMKKGIKPENLPIMFYK